MVEDLYESPGYPKDDERFVHLMRLGHETFFLRLSPFREAVAGMLAEDGRVDASHIDAFLHRVGRHVFQAAWHEDQRPGIVAAQHFGLPRFREAIELLYLCLSGEMCDLRSAVDDKVLTFFETAYPQPAIRELLLRLEDLDGDALNDIPRAAIEQYDRLSTEFSRFLTTEVRWGRSRTTMPLYKLIFGNFERLDRVAAQLAGDASVEDARERLEGAAGRVIDAIVG